MPLFAGRLGHGRKELGAYNFIVAMDRRGLRSWVHSTVFVVVRDGGSISRAVVKELLVALQHVPVLLHFTVRVCYGYGLHMNAQKISFFSIKNYLLIFN